MNIDKKDLVEYRKANYWRGFRVALLFLVPILVFLAILVELLIKAVE